MKKKRIIELSSPEMPYVSCINCDKELKNGTKEVATHRNLGHKISSFFVLRPTKKTVKEYVTHTKDKRTGICYVRKRTEEYQGRCKEHNKEKDEK